MRDVLFSPPIAFVIYGFFAFVLYGFGRILAGPSSASSIKSSTYASGEAPPTKVAVPGYRPFFVMALFFAILHLGVLVLGSGQISLMTGAYLGGLFIVLLVLILG
jgi:NADH:ubiquinone oxidoreductase subunit 3 (subunit A)